MEEIEKLYREYKPLVHQYLYEACRDSLLAEEIAQDTFVCILSRCSKNSRFIPGRFFKKRKSVEQQIFHLAKQLLSTELLRQEKNPSAENALDLAAEIPTLDYLPEPFALYNEELHQTYEKIKKLKEPMRKVIFLKYYGDRSYKEIAESLGQSENWVRHMITKGRAQIEQMLISNF